MTFLVLDDDLYRYCPRTSTDQLFLLVVFESRRSNYFFLCTVYSTWSQNQPLFVSLLFLVVRCFWNDDESFVNRSSSHSLSSVKISVTVTIFVTNLSFFQSLLFFFLSPMRWRKCDVTRSCRCVVCVLTLTVTVIVHDWHRDCEALFALFLLIFVFIFVVDFVLRSHYEVFDKHLPSLPFLITAG